MDQHVGIRMTQEAQGVLDAHAAQPERAALHQAVDIVAIAYTNHLLREDLRPKRSFMPSRSKPSVKRIVWSRGLVCEVAKT